MTEVLVNGCFDVLHVGHIWHLKEASTLGKVTVALTNNLQVEAEKGKGRPINTWTHRAEVLRSLREVHEVVASNSLIDVLYMLRPKYLVKGRDWEGRMPKNVLKACDALDTKIIFTKSPKMSSTEIIQKCALVA